VWAPTVTSVDFFPGEGKIFQWGGVQKNYISQKTTKKILFSFLKNWKTYYFGRPGGGKGPLLPSPADANECSM